MQRNLFLTIALLVVNVFCRADDTLEGGLEKLRPFLGTWRGELKSSTADRPLVDTAVWERALNGKAIRILHSINDGLYGGESLALWDAKAAKVTYHYFTTAGFQTTGTITVEGNKVMTHEKILGDAGGPTEVRGVTELRKDGTMHRKAEFLKNGAWEPGHEITYRRANDAKVLFK